MIGDTMETDILGGVQLGFHTVLVLSGGTRPDDLPRYAYRPEIVVESLAELADLLDATTGDRPEAHRATSRAWSLKRLAKARLHVASAPQLCDSG